MSDVMKGKYLLGLSLQELTDIAVEASQPSYRGKQLFQALYSDLVRSVDAISTLPADFRRNLAERELSVGFPSVEKKFRSTDGTVRYLIGFSDAQSVETVWMPEGDSGESGDGTEAGELTSSRQFDRATICVSSQVGCAVAC